MHSLCPRVGLAGDHPACPEVLQLRSADTAPHQEKNLISPSSACSHGDGRSRAGNGHTRFYQALLFSRLSAHRLHPAPPSPARLCTSQARAVSASVCPCQSRGSKLKSQEKKGLKMSSRFLCVPYSSGSTAPEERGCAWWVSTEGEAESQHTASRTCSTNLCCGSVKAETSPKHQSCLSPSTETPGKREDGYEGDRDSGCRQKTERTTASVLCADAHGGVDPL